MGIHPRGVATSGCWLLLSIHQWGWVGASHLHLGAAAVEQMFQLIFYWRISHTHLMAQLNLLRERFSLDKLLLSPLICCCFGGGGCFRHSLFCSAKVHLAFVYWPHTHNLTVMMGICYSYSCGRRARPSIRRNTSGEEEHNSGKELTEKFFPCPTSFRPDIKLS